MFNTKGEVALISKTHPEWQAGKLNGVGGAVEGEETPPESMRREFLEEAGILIEAWREFTVLAVEGGVVHFFVAHGDYDVHSMTEEQIDWYPWDALGTLPLIPNLKWLIPLAPDSANLHAVVECR